MRSQAMRRLIPGVVAVGLLTCASWALAASPPPMRIVATAPPPVNDGSESTDTHVVDTASETLTAAEDSTAPPTRSTPSATSRATPANSPGFEVDAPEPIGVRIPVIEVDAPTIALGLREDGTIDVPTDVDDTGWWQDGPEPGEQGPAVILGHVDSYTGPGVFARLYEIEPGTIIHVDRADGSTVDYRVTTSEQHDKDSFPTELVYGPTDDAVLRLVTCGGEFDTDERSYLANLIVFAELIEA